MGGGNEGSEIQNKADLSNSMEQNEYGKKGTYLIKN